MTEAFARRGCVGLAAALGVLIAACPAARRPRPAPLDPDRIEDNRLLPPPGPDFPAAPGKEALRRWATACREAGAQHAPVFRNEGRVVISWVADRAGDLLQLEFPADSFRGWEVQPGITFADCIVRQARAAELRWSRAGTAPLRLLPAGDAASQPAVVPDSRPAAASRPTTPEVHQ